MTQLTQKDLDTGALIRVNLVVTRQLWIDLLRASGLKGVGRAEFIRKVLEAQCRVYLGRGPGASGSAGEG